MFSDVKKRRRFAKEVFENFRLGEPERGAAQKADQFFVPGAKGHLDETKIASAMNNLDMRDGPTGSIFDEPIEISGIKGMMDYVPPDLENRLRAALKGVDVKVNLSTPFKSESDKFRKTRDFDAYILAVGMSKRVLGEALNLQYLASPPRLMDPTGRVKTLMKSYQNATGSRIEQDVIREIAVQMIADAELIPLYYFGSPLVVNRTSVSSTDLNLEESIKFSKVEMN